jgi:cytochrome c5
MMSTLDGFLTLETVPSTTMTTEGKEQHSTTGTLTVPHSQTTLEQEDMLEATCQLCHAKRRMLLKLTDEPTSSVDRFSMAC